MTGSLEAAMEFVAKSVFWLGLVYSAMPFDSGTPIALRQRLARCPARPVRRWKASPPP